MIEADGQGVRPCFSILIPVRDGAGRLLDTLGSLLAQSCAHWEAFVVHGASGEGFGQDIPGDPRIQVVSQVGEGLATSLNEALRHAQGEWVCLISAGDLLEPDALDIFREAIRNDPGVGFFHGDALVMHEEYPQKRPRPKEEEPPPKEGFEPIAFLVGFWVQPSSVCVQKRLFQQAGPFDPAFRFAPEWDMWLRFSLLTPMKHLERYVCAEWPQTDREVSQARTLDANRACLRFLNSHRWEDLFPGCDLSTVEGASAPIQQTLMAVLDPKACMYAGVDYVPALLERFGEWFVQSCPPAARASVLPVLKRLAASERECPVPIRTLLGQLAEGRCAPYVPHDDLEHMWENLERLVRLGIWREAIALKRYLATAKPEWFDRTSGQFRPCPLEQEAFLFEPEWDQPDWVEVLLSYLQAFKPGECVTLVLLLDPLREGQIPVSEAEERILQVVQSVGFSEFPNVAIVDKREELHGTLRSFNRFQWVPKGRGRVDGLQGRAGMRLGQARMNLVR